MPHLCKDLSVGPNNMKKKRKRKKKVGRGRGKKINKKGKKPLKQDNMIKCLRIKEYSMF